MSTGNNTTSSTMKVAAIDRNWWCGRLLDTCDSESVGHTQVDWSMEPHDSGWVISCGLPLLFSLAIKHYT